MTDARKEIKTRTALSQGFFCLVQWFDTDFGNQNLAAIRAKPDRIELVRVAPFILLHLGCLGVLLAGWSWTAIAVAVAL